MDSAVMYVCASLLFNVTEGRLCYDEGRLDCLCLPNNVQ